MMHTLTTALHPTYSSCPITNFYLRPYQRINDCIWYPIEIQLNHSGQLYELIYKYDDFINFSRLLHQQFNISKTQLPKIKKEYRPRCFSLKKGNQKYIDRQLELEKFCHHLLLLPASITCSDLFLMFFSMKLEDREKQQRLALETFTKNSLRRAFSFRRMSFKKQDPDDFGTLLFSQSWTVDMTEAVCRSNRSSTASTATTVSNSSVQSGEHRMPLQPSFSLTSINSLTADTENTSIKFKIIYDSYNIIVIRVSRSISLDQLRSKVIQKFALLNICLPDQLVLCCSSAASSHHSSVCFSSNNNFLSAMHVPLESDIVISEQADFSNAMQQRWSSLRKVTLRCVL
ncbi:MAG: hypothetical protein EXX96DRAFT_556333 [Benjaminiella poitrasii]|nr:MAG: hypothetical protein EXX96DRAFT_556333 [Benjaminiella poitrasii]